MEILSCQSNEDIRLISELAKEVYHEHYSKFLSKDFVDYWVDLYQSYENIVKSVANGEKYFFIKSNNEIVGYFSYTIENNNNKMFLSKLYIKLKHRKNGFGKQSLTYLYNLAKSKKINEIYLKTMRKNPSVNFYINNGFKITETVETDLGNGYILEDYVLTNLLY